ncbi:MAG: hypothetical protein LC118_19965 [Dehalococcoidia bacterium]|nr:hypothetical protein [Dehalococcoidia bacterium]
MSLWNQERAREATDVLPAGLAPWLRRELAHRFDTVCGRKKRAPEALSYNALVQSWPEILRLAREGGARDAAQAGLLADA